MATKPDLVLYDRDDEKVAVVIIKNRRNTTRQWAAEYRRNLTDLNLFRRAEFFLLATPDRLYLWKNHGNDPDLISPDYEADGRQVFGPYIEIARLNPEDFSTYAFELIVANWLSELALEVEDSVRSQGWLVESGFLDAIKRGRIEHQAAA